MKADVVVLLAAAVSVGLVGPGTAAPAWLDETFDNYTVGPLDGQGQWTGNTRRICVVSTTSLAGNAVCCDADESSMLPVIWEVGRPVSVPDGRRHLFSFAVRVETPTASFAPQAALVLGSDQTDAIELFISPLTADMTIRNDFVDTYWTASWDLGSVSGGYPDLTTGTFHIFEIEIDLGRVGDVMDDFVLDVRLDGVSQKRFFTPDFPAYMCLEKPISRMRLINWSAIEGMVDDAVYFDSLVGRSLSLSAGRWYLYR